MEPLMSPEAQMLFNIVAGVAGLFGSFILKSQWDAIKEGQKERSDLARQIASVEVLVAGDYAKREDVDRLGAALFAKLDRMEGKLDNKVDKP
jgi:hypothetical protein